VKSWERDYDAHNAWYIHGLVSILVFFVRRTYGLYTARVKGFMALIWAGIRTRENS
jgi:hypothetical protein